jgi:GNAT superfamily N-acetyltransferase
VTPKPRPLESPAGFLGLLREAYGNSALTEDEFAWWYENGPEGPATLAEVADGRTLGVLGTSYARVLAGGVERLAAFPIGAVTLPEARGRGIFGALVGHEERAAATRGAAVGIAFPSGQSRGGSTGPVFVERLGWSDLRRMRIWARPLRLRRSGPGPPPARRAGYLERFEPSHEWRPRSGIVRDTRYLTWRYLEAPRDYRVLGGEGGFVALGFAVQKGFRAAVVLDLVGRPLRRLLRRAVREAAGSDLVIGVPPRGQAAAWLSCGFLPTPLTIRAVGKSLDGRPLPRDWQFSLGDTDIF